MTIAVIGLGYVGLPLALAFAETLTPVLGLDIDDQKVKLLNQGNTYLQHISEHRIQSVINANLFKASTDFSSVEACQSLIICVPTPLNRFREPDISYILDTGTTVAKWLQPGTLVVLESTTYPGTTEGELRQVLEVGSGLSAG